MTKVDMIKMKMFLAIEPFAVLHPSVSHVKIQPLTQVYRERSRALRELLERSWRLFERSWDSLEAMLGPSWSHHGTIMEPSWGHLEAIESHHRAIPRAHSNQFENA